MTNAQLMTINPTQDDELNIPDGNKEGGLNINSLIDTVSEIEDRAIRSLREPYKFNTSDALLQLYGVAQGFADISPEVSIDKGNGALVMRTENDAVVLVKENDGEGRPSLSATAIWHKPDENKTYITVLKSTADGSYHGAVQTRVIDTSVDVILKEMGIDDRYISGSEGINLIGQPTVLTNPVPYVVDIAIGMHRILTESAGQSDGV